MAPTKGRILAALRLKIRDLTTGCEGEIETPLDAAECFDRLSAVVPEGRFLTSTTDIYGEIDVSGGTLRKASFFQNTMAPALVYRVQAKETGSRIAYRSAVHGGVLGLLVVWTVILLVFSAGGLGSALSRGAWPDAETWAPLVMIGLGWALLPWGRWLAKIDGQWLAEFIARTVDGRIVR